MGFAEEELERLKRIELREFDVLDDCSLESCVVTVTVSGDLLPESGSQYLLSFRR